MGKILNRVRQTWSRMAQGIRVKTKDDWLEFLEDVESDRLFREIYGDRPKLITERKRSLAQLAKHFASTFGEGREMILIHPIFHASKTCDI